MMVWIQFRRMPDVIAERVNLPSFVYKADKDKVSLVTSPPTPKGRPTGRTVASATCVPHSG